MVAYNNTPGWFNSDDFYFNKIIESNYDGIKAECDYLIENNLFVPHIQSKESSFEHNEKTPVLANKWNMFELGHSGEFHARAKELVPFTYKLLDSFPEIRSCKTGRFYFSMVPANAVVASHVSGLKPNTRLRHQLCLQTVEGADVYIEVNGDRRTWSQGKIISFDDAFDHHVKNNSPHTRIVLIYDTVEL